MTLTGTGLTGATKVVFGTISATSLVVASGTSLTVTAPAHAAGVVDVRVTTPGGTSAVASSDAYTYATPPPVITGITPGTGATTGGTQVTVTGNGLTGATTVGFGTTAGSDLTIVSATSVTVTAPAHTTGPVDVTVTTPAGTSTTSTADVFTYTRPAVPTITGLTPSTGPATGGGTVTVTGTGFTGATGVTFGATAGTSVAVASPTTLTVTSPAHAAGVVDVKVTAPGGTTKTTSADKYTYTTPGPSAPTVTKVSPTSGPTTGGIRVTITGTGLTGATAVTFGTTPGTGLTVVSATKLTVTAPAHAAGPVDVTVTTPAGTSTTNSADTYTYISTGPTLTQVSPTTGPTTGATKVTVIGTGLTGATAVTFGTTTGTNLTAVSSTKLTVTAPAHTAGTVDVTVTTPAGTSPTSSADQYTYTPAAAPVTNHCGTITTNQTWTPATTHVLTCAVTINAGKTLTIQPGTIIKATDGAELTVDGTLVATGTSTSPITFTSLTDDTLGGDTNGDGSATTPTNSSWGGIDFGGQTTPVSLDHVNVRYAGAYVNTSAPTVSVSNSSFSDGTGLSITGGDPTTSVSVTNSAISNSTGLRVVASQAITVSGDTVTNSYGGYNPAGIQVQQVGLPNNSAASTTTVTNNTVSGAIGDGIQVQADPVSSYPDPPLDDVPAPTVTGNTVRNATYTNNAFNGSPAYGLTAGVAVAVSGTNLLPTRLTGNTGTGNTLNVLEIAGTLRGDLTLPVSSGLPITIGYNDYRLCQGLDVGSGTTLTIQPGATIKFDTQPCALGSAPGLTVDGTLVATGTSTSPITFTSLTDDTLGGDTNGDGSATTPTNSSWGGIDFGGQTTPVSLDHVNVRYAGAYVNTSAPTVSVSNSSFSDGTGLSITGGDPTTSVSVTNSAISNSTGLRVVASQAITVSGDTVTNSYGGYNPAGIQVQQVGLPNNSAASTTTVTNNTVSGAIGDGIQVQADPVSSYPDPPLDDVPAPTVTGNTVRNATYTNNAFNGSPAYGLTAGVAVAVSGTNLLPTRLTGNTGTGNTLNVLEIAGTLRGDLTLPVSSGLPITIGYNDYRLCQGLDVGSGTTLTIQPGATIKFDTQPCALGSAPGLTVDGTLVATGTSTSPITFTSLTDDTLGGDTNGDGSATTPTNSSWGGIDFGGQTTPVSLDHVNVRYAGAYVNTSAPTVSVSNSSFSDGTGLSITGGDPTTSVSVTNSAISNSTGLRVVASQAITVSGDTVTNSYGGYNPAGIQVQQVGLPNNSAASTTTVTNNTVSGAIGDGIQVQADPVSSYPDPPLDDVPAPTVTGNTVRNATYTNNAFNGSPAYGLTAGVAVAVSGTNLLPTRLTGNTGTGNTLNVLEIAGTLRGDLTLPVSSGLPITIGYNDYRLCQGLDVGSGTTLTIQPGATIKFDTQPCALGSAPGLTVDGTLVATGTSTSPITFTSLTDDTLGGDTNGDGNASTPIPGDWDGIAVTDGAVASLNGTYIKYAATALTVADDTAVELHGSVATSAFGVLSDDTYVDATNVDWGSASGPSPIGTGVGYSGNAVAVEPWVGYTAPTPAPSNPPTNPSPQGCVGIDFVGVRGSGEDPQGSSVVQDPVPDDPSQIDTSQDGLGTRTSSAYQGLYNEVHASRPNVTFKDYGLQYRALGVFYDPLLHGTQAYFDSIYDGVDQLIYYIKYETAKCPTEKLVLSGFSQGSLVIHIAMRRLDKSNPSLLSNAHLAGIALIADPAKVAKPAEFTLEQYDKVAGSGISKANGIWTKFPLFPSDVGPLPSSVTGKTIAFCQNHDPVCAPPSLAPLLLGPGGQAAVVAQFVAYASIHTGPYYPTYSDVLGRWVADKYLGTPFTLGPT